MRASFSWTVCSLILLSGCTGISTAPNAEVRNAVAPAGKLKVGVLLASDHATKDPATGELRGIAIDMARGATQRLGVGLETVGYTTFAALWSALTTNELDAAIMAVTAERAKTVDYSRPYVVVEFTYLVDPKVPASTPAELDKQGISVAVLKDASTHAYLSTHLKYAQSMPLATVAEMVQAASTGKAQALYGTRAGMLNQSRNFPGWRVMQASFGGQETAFAVTKGQPARLSYLSNFVAHAKAEGLVSASIERMGMKGMVVAP